MRGFDVLAFMQMAKVKPVVRRPPPHGAPDGTYVCFVREIRYWSGTRAGETEALQGGDWELNVITDQNLLWEFEDAESRHNGLPIEIAYRPGGIDQLVAHNADFSLVLRIALAPNQETNPTSFVALGTNVALAGICYFKPRVTP
jgi:hypothetical protein